MQARDRKNEGRKTAGFVLTALAAAMASLGSCAQAQDVRPALEEINVTGSRIRQPGLTSPTPVTSLTQEELENLAPGTLMDALDLLPQFVNSTTIEDTGSVFAGSWSTVGGQSTLNMRGVGGNRTLVLLDGRRVVPSNRLSTVDISLFPQALIRRTDAVTGGASAAYGSDAIAGVTNFILDTEFEGFSANLQGGVSDLGDAESFRTSLAGGRSIGERGHFILGGEHYKQASIDNFDDRDWYRDWGDINYGATGGVPNQTPQRVRYPNLNSRTATFGGLIPSGPLAGTEFLADGTPVPYTHGEILDPTAERLLNTRTAANPNGTIGGNQVGGSGDDLNRDRLVQAEQERASVLGRFAYDLNDTTRLTLQGIYGYSFVGNQKWGYVFTPPWALTIYSDNAFLPESLRQQMADAGVSSFQLNKEGSPRDLIYNSKAPMTTQMYSLTSAIDGEIGRWNYSAYYQYGTSNRDLDLHGYRVDRFYRGVDSVRHPDTGQIVCSSTLIQPSDGCVPINVFGRNNESPEARSWVNDSMWLDAELTQHATEISVDGQLLEGWAGPIFLAGGVSYRRDELLQIGGNAGGSPVPIPPDGPVTDRDANGNLLYRGLPRSYLGYNLIDRAGGATVDGSFEVYEAFSETLIPIVRDAPGMQGIDVTLAARLADYQGSGQVWAWKAGIDWQIVDDLRFRLTRSRDIRAASLSERFDQTATGGNVTDRFLDDLQYTIRSIQGGNPEVKPEHSDTITYGFVYQPSWTEGLSMSADYFDMKITGAISQIGTQNIMDDCFDFGAYCDQIQRLQDGTVDAIFNVFINVGQARTRGLDLEVGLRRPVEWFGGGESVSVRMIASRLLEASTTPYGSDRIDRVGDSTFADWNATLNASYIRGPLSLTWTERWRSGVVRNLTWVSGVDVDDNTIPSQSSSNLRVNYGFDTASGSSYSIYAAVTNVFDRNPLKVQGLSNIWGNIGRAYTLGMRYNY